jgi:hypothetical protein
MKALTGASPISSSIFRATPRSAGCIRNSSRGRWKTAFDPDPQGQAQPGARPLPRGGRGHVCRFRALMISIPSRENSMSHRVNRLAAGLALAGCANLAHAAGFALIEQNASGLGNAYAGQAAAATDASTIFFNPAGMTYLPDRQVVVAGHLIVPQAEFSGSVSPDIGGGNGGDAGAWRSCRTPICVPPDAGRASGRGINAPFGLKTEYDPTGKAAPRRSNPKSRPSTSIPRSPGRPATRSRWAPASASSTPKRRCPIPPTARASPRSRARTMAGASIWACCGRRARPPGIGLAYRSEVEHTLKAMSNSAWRRRSTAA